MKCVENLFVVYNMENKWYACEGDPEDIGFSLDITKDIEEADLFSRAAAHVYINERPKCYHKQYKLIPVKITTEYGIEK